MNINSETEILLEAIIIDLVQKWHEDGSRNQIWEFIRVSRDDYNSWVERKISSQELLNRRYEKS